MRLDRSPMRLVNAIETSALTKRYGRVPALAGVDLNVPKATIFGFLGPNGAGKTTTLRILVGLLKPTSGSARVFGRDITKQLATIKRDIGYLPGDVHFHEWMSGRALLAFCDEARGSRAHDEIERLTDRFKLDLSRRIREYSRGMKQKLGLIQALMHRPALLILDEPSSGLDPLVQHTLHDELRDAASRGQTVLFSSHTLSEVEALCDHVAIIREGRIIEDSEIATLRARALRRVEFRLKDGAPRDIGVRDDFVVTKAHDGVYTGSWRGSPESLLRWLASLSPADVVIEPPALEDLFATYYADDDHGDPEHHREGALP